MEINVPHPKLKKLLVYKILRHIQNYWGHFLGLHRVLILGLFEVIRAHYWDRKFGVETGESCDIDDKYSLHQDGQEYVPTPPLWP